MDGTQMAMDSGPTSARAPRRRLTWPVFLITLGLILLLDQLAPNWSIDKTWPVLLVAVGVAQVLDSSVPPRPPQGPRL